MAAELPLLGIQRPAGSGPAGEVVEELLEEEPPAELAGTSSDDVPHVPQVTLSNLFRHALAHPIALDMCLLKKYGPEWFSWEWETVQLRIEQDFRGGLSTLNLSKIMAVACLHLVDTYWQRWEVFCWGTMPFNNTYADFETMQKPGAVDCMISIDTANRIRQDVPWDPEVLAYLGVLFRYDGLLCPIPPCEFVTGHLPIADLELDTGAIQEAWPKVRDSRRLPTDESVKTEQLRRMLVAYDALEENRARLKQQLALVDHV